MTNTNLFSVLAVIAGLCSGILVTPGEAASIVDMRVQIEGVNGIIEQTDRLELGSDRMTSEIGVGRLGANTGAQTTFERTPIDRYAAQLDKTPGYQFLGDTAWWAKQSAHLQIDYEFPWSAHVWVRATRTRGSENRA